MHQAAKSSAQCVAVIGTQWGDEGKGKFIDALSSQFDVICRSAGGANAGHTVYAEEKKYIFHLLPSGLLHPNTTGIIGNGCVVDVNALVEEIETLQIQGLNLENRIKLSLRSHLILEYHKKIDQEQERRKGDRKIGTTGRGIGPAYSDKFARIGIRAEDILDKELLREKIEKNVTWHKNLWGIDISASEEYERIMAVREKIKPLLENTGRWLREEISAGKKILFEGAQAHHLDVDYGTYPFVTSASVSAGGIFTGLGVPPMALGEIVGIAKAYTTRVGEGPFPTELNNDLEEKIRKIGREFGATTGRPRRCGWFDAVMVRESIVVNGMTKINLTKLDVLTGLPEVKIAKKYRLDGQEIFTIPTTRKALEKLEIEYETLPGWTEPLGGIRSWDTLPKNAQKYIETVESFLECPISTVGTGVDRNDLIFR